MAESTDRPSAEPLFGILSSDAASGTTDVVVIGGGVAGLVAARQLAHLGNTVTVVESREAVGGFVATREIAGVRLDSGAESFATRKGTVASLVTELGLGDDIVVPAEAGAWVAWDGGIAPLPASGVLGIPGVPLADDVRRIIGWGGSLRAYLDRLMPLLRVRAETDLGDIVRRRMGRRVLDRLVTPVVAGVHSADPSVVDVHTVAPGLTQAMTTQGSLSGAVMALREQAPAGSQVQGIAGGVYRLIEALEADCRYYGVQFRTATRVSGLSRAGGGEWTVGLAPADGASLADLADADADASDDAGANANANADAYAGGDAHADDLGAASPLVARAVVVATGFRTGLALLAEAGVGRGGEDAPPSLSPSPARAGMPAPEPSTPLPPQSDWPEPASVTIATLVVDDARLDAHPRGTGVLVAPGTPRVTAKALTHSSAKWRWLADSLPAHRHVLRLSYGRRGADARPSSEPAVDLATVLADASALLGVPLSEADVAGFDTMVWAESLAFATVGHKARVRQTLAAVQRVAGLDVVGAWVSGTGLAATVEHAQTTASGLAAELRGDRRLDAD
ncbi:FAD-dependent oxidoreductase [Herbiconiux sp. CPCC 205763]|uniref:FAD-dependent oxidoreductase n=1 Tax=Herbiconiux aconitum TaxID=2970913 RepID=A0ABT2GMN1_9MICO|nr:FAD-dependent oxidoreductase [Herbiconiux aconitum]MCS5717479.1 FAD-dependent oxidoreductase [Herbiconiux aconitum]